MGREPLVTAIIPTYNRAGLIGEAIDSVLAQSYPCVEIIVVDDGSTDDTQARLRRYGSKIRVVTQDNAGPSAARNRGIAVSEGMFTAFLDSDDIWLPTKLERQITLLQKVDKSVPCCLCNIIMKGDAGERASFEISSLNPSIHEGIWLNVDEVLVTRCVLFNQGVAIRREVLERTGGFDESLWLLEDHELALRLSREGPWAFIREPLVIWREDSGGSLSKKASKERSRVNRTMVHILEKQLALIDAAHGHAKRRRQVKRELRRALRDLAATEMSQMSSRVAAGMGHLLQKSQHYRSALFRRSPWYPKMKVVAEAGPASRTGLPWQPWQPYDGAVEQKIVQGGKA